MPGPRLGGELRGLLLPRHHRRRSGAHGPAVRALPVEGARRAAGHRPRHRARAARGGDPARLREVRPRPRRDGRERHPLPPAVGGARRRQGARPLARRRSIAWRSCSRTTASVDAGRARAQRASTPRRRCTGTCSRLSDEILDFPRHLSIHPGGFLLGHEPVHDIVPIENATMPDRTVIQWDKDDVEAIGPVQGRPARPRRAHAARPGFRSAAAAPRRSICRWRRSPPDDPPTYDMICRGRHRRRRSRSRAARRCRCCRASSRASSTTWSSRSASCGPGPITGGMVHPYLRRRNGEEPVDLSARLPRAGAREDARRAALPGAGDAARDRGRRLHARRGRPAPPRHGGLAAHRAASRSTASA